MKIAVCAQGESLTSQVDARFGRCGYFVISDTETGENSAFPNPSLSALQGAAVATVQFLSSKGVEAVIAQNIGPNAHSALAAAGIKVFFPEGGTVQESLTACKEGSAREHSGATVASHHGLTRQ